MSHYSAITELDFERYIRPSISHDQINGTKKFIINSLPRSGTIWLMCLIQDILEIKREEQLVLSHVFDIVDEWQDKRVHHALVIVRDIKDIVVSLYDYTSRTDLENGFNQPRYQHIEEFYFQHFLGLIQGLDRYGYGDIISWLNFAAARQMPIIRYEDMLTDPAKTLQKVFVFWKIKVPEDIVQRAVKKHSFSNMLNQTPNTENQISSFLKRKHLSQGKSGVWQTRLTERTLTDINSRFSEYLNRMAYGITV